MVRHLVRHSLVLLCCLAGSMRADAQTDPYARLKQWMGEHFPKLPLREDDSALRGLAKSLVNSGLKSLAKSAEGKAAQWLGSQLDDCLAEPKLGTDLFVCPTGGGAAEEVRVWFVNGVWTTETGAKNCGAALAHKLGQPVQLVFNPGEFGTLNDLREAAFDKAWPLRLGAAVIGRSIPQENATTQHLAWMLLHSTGKIDLVTHSQGCLIARNAILIAALRDPSVLERVAWVAVASPLRAEEYLVTPVKFHDITHADDVVAQQLGKLPYPEKWNGGDFKLSEIKLSDFTLLDFPGKHGFTEAYLAEIASADLWPSMPAAGTMVPSQK